MICRALCITLLAVDLAVAAPGADLAPFTEHVARAMGEALWANGTLSGAEKAYVRNPVGGGDVVAFQWMMADFLRLQRQEFRDLLARVDRVLTISDPFLRQKAIVGTLDRIVTFKKANRRFLSIGEFNDEGRMAGLQLEAQVERLRATLRQMDARVSDLKNSLSAAM